MGFVSLNTGYTGLSASQLGIDTTSHNVANANTDGYTRQRVEQRSRLPRDTREGFVGTGVEAYDITRARDDFLDARMRSASTVLGSLTANAELLSRAEAVIGEPDNGISTELDGLFDAFEDMALTPNDPAARTYVVSSLGRLTDRIREIDRDLGRLEDDAATNLRFAVDDVNAALREVADLNQAINEAATSGNSPNDLLDARDRKLDELAEELGVTVTRLDGTDIRVSLNGMGLVEGTIVNQLTLDPTTHEITHPTGLSVTPGGEVGGAQRFLTTDLPTLHSNLDTFVDDLVTTLNDQHALGHVDATTTGGPLLSVVAGDEAATLAVAVTSGDELAASSVGGTPFPVFNGENAQAMADLRTAMTSGGGSTTLGGAVRQLVTDLGAQTASMQRAAEAQDELVAAAELARDSQHAVSIDEEMVHLVRYQRAYQAAARIITAADQALDTLINRTGVVGR